MNNSHADDAGAISIFLLFVGLLYGLWYFSDRILDVWRDVIVPVAHAWAWVSTTEAGASLAKLFHRDPAKLQAIPAYLASLTPEQLKAAGYGEAKKYGDYVHRFTSLLVAPLMLIAAYRFHQHAKMMNPVMFGVISGIPAITRVIKKMPGREWMNEVIDASEKPLFSGEIGFQAPITPWRLATLYGLVELDEKDQVKSFDKERAATVFAKTLGAQFKTLDDIEKGQYAKLWAALMKQVPAADRPAAARAALKGHLYQKTAVIALIRQMSRLMVVDYGPLMFMRYKDIAFYDAICSCGRRTAFSAGAGIMGQFRHEVSMFLASKGTVQPEPQAGALWAADWLEEAVRTDPMEKPWEESQEIWDDFDPWE